MDPLWLLLPLIPIIGYTWIFIKISSDNKKREINSLSRKIAFTVDHDGGVNTSILIGDYLNVRFTELFYTDSPRSLDKAKYKLIKKFQILNS